MDQKILNQEKQDLKRIFEKRIRNRALNQAYHEMNKNEKLMMGKFVNQYSNHYNLNEKEKSEYLEAKEQFKYEYIRELTKLTIGWNIPSKEKYNLKKWGRGQLQKVKGYKKKNILDECILY